MKSSLLPMSNKLLQETFTEIQSVYYPLVRICQARRRYICEGQRETDKNLSGSQQAPGEAGQLITLPGLLAKRRKVAGSWKVRVWKSWKQEGRRAWWDAGTMEKSEEETLEVSFSSRRRKGMYIYQKEVKNRLQEKRLGIVPISLLQSASNTPWVYKQVCNLQIPHIFKVPSSPPSFLMELSSCDQLTWSCFYSFSHMQSLFLETERTMFPKPGHDVKPTLFSAHLFQNHLFGWRRLSLQCRSRMPCKCSVIFNR